MKACLVVEIEVGVDSFLQFLHCFIAFKVDVLVLEASPQTLNSDVIQSPVFSVHTDLYVIVFKNFDKDIRCKLASLIRVEDCRTTIFFNCFPQKICILQCVHGIEYTPAQNFSREPVDYCHQVYISCRQFYICDIRLPYLIRISYNLVFQKIRIFLVVSAGL